MSATKISILRHLDPASPDTIQALIDFHRRHFGGSQMEVEADPGGDEKPPAGDGKPAEDGKHADDEILGEGGKKALKAERDARQALEKQVTDLKNSQIDPKKLAEALGIKLGDAKSSGDDMVTALQKQVSDMQHESRLYRIVAKHQITDGDDVELLRSLGDEVAMERLATRLAKESSRDGSADNGKGETRRPRGDKSQGRGGDGDNRPSSVAQVIEERRAAREAKK